MINLVRYLNTWSLIKQLWHWFPVNCNNLSCKTVNCSTQRAPVSLSFCFCICSDVIETEATVWSVFLAFSSNPLGWIWLSTHWDRHTCILCALTDPFWELDGSFWEHYDHKGRASSAQTEELNSRSNLRRTPSHNFICRDFRDVRKRMSVKEYEIECISVSIHGEEFVKGSKSTVHVQINKHTRMLRKPYWLKSLQLLIIITDESFLTFNGSEITRFFDVVIEPSAKNSRYHS